jgi:hypothetical protein
MQKNNRMQIHGRRAHNVDVASFFSNVDQVEMEFLALEQILSQMTRYLEIISKEVNRSPKEWGFLPKC